MNESWISDPHARLGSIAVVLGKGSSTIWRFGDDISDTIDFASGRRWT